MSTTRMFKGENLKQWAKHFSIQDKTLEVLAAWGAEEVSDLEDIISDDGLMKELKQAIPQVEYDRIVKCVKFVEVLDGVSVATVAKSTARSTEFWYDLDYTTPATTPSTARSITTPQKTATLGNYFTALVATFFSVWWNIALSITNWKRSVASKTSTTAALSDRMREIRELESRLHRMERDNARKTESGGSDKTTAESSKSRKPKSEAHKIEKRKKVIQKIDKQLKEAATVDVAIVLDCTGSMARYIKKCAEDIISLVENIGTVYPHLTLRLAFIGYRDHCDGSDRLCVLRNGSSSRFTTDVEEFRTFVRGVDAKGGGDGPEDVMGGLNVAADLEWASKCRILYHIGDAPCHGRKYHNMTRDDFPTGDPNELTPEVVLKKLHEHEIIYYFGKLCDSTDRMIQEFNKVAPKSDFIQTAEMNATTLMKVMTDTISSSVSSTFSTSTYTDSEVVKMTDLTIVNTMPIWSTVREDTGMRYPMQKITSVEELLTPAFRCIQNMPERTPINLKIAPNPFAKGAMKAAFYTKTQGWFSEDVVLKSSMATSARHQTCENYERFLTCHVAAHFLAEQFNRVRPYGCPSIRYVRASIMQIQSRPSRPYFIEEETIKGEFEKFNNNNGMCRPFPTKLGTDHRAVQAFSHWTYEHSKHRIMVVDCQGYYDKSNKTFILTDPAVHCESLFAFGCTNLQKTGFERFFMTHQCNEYCRALNLPKSS